MLKTALLVGDGFPNAERMVHCLESGCPQDCPGGNLLGPGVQNPCPWKISQSSGNVFSNTSLLSAVYGYILGHLYAFQCIQCISLLPIFVNFNFGGRVSAFAANFQLAQSGNNTKY